MWTVAYCRPRFNLVRVDIYVLGKTFQVYITPPGQIVSRDHPSPSRMWMGLHSHLDSIIRCPCLLAIFGTYAATRRREKPRVR